MESDSIGKFYKLIVPKKLMSFVRVKKINGKKYAYLVSNRWRKRLAGGRKGSRQKVSKYLGKVVSFDVVLDTGFFEYVNIRDNPDYLALSKRKIVMDLVKFELIIRGFKQNGVLLDKEGMKFDERVLKFVDSKGREQRVVIEMNEGFLCKHTISKLLNFKPRGEDEREIGIELAKTFLEAGLKVPEEVFVGYFEKV